MTFALDGVSYEIDLTRQRRRSCATPWPSWVGHARSAPAAARHRPRPRRRQAGKRDLGDVREWARDNGHQVSDRGRISAEVQAAYDKAH